MPLKARKNMLAIIDQPMQAMNTQLDAVAQRLDSLVSSPAPIDMSLIEKLIEDVETLKARRERAWVFDVERDGNGRILRVTAKQGREALT
jgi:hypothetical protein